MTNDLARAIDSAWDSREGLGPTGVPSGDGQTAGTTPTETSLVGPTWRLSSLEGRDAVPGTHVTAEFGADDRVTGSAGCNRYFGHAAAKGDQLDVGLLATTMMHCGADGVMQQEQAYLAALEKAKVYRVADGRLRLGPTAAAVTIVFDLE